MNKEKKSTKRQSLSVLTLGIIIAGYTLSSCSHGQRCPAYTKYKAESQKQTRV